MSKRRDVLDDYAVPMPLRARSVIKIDRLNKTAIGYESGVNNGNMSGTTYECSECHERAKPLQSKEDGCTICGGALKARRRWYNRRSYRGVKRVRTIINYMAVEQFEDPARAKKKASKQVWFVTVTTKQHETHLSDKQCYAAVGDWLRRRFTMGYACVVERQSKANSCITIRYPCGDYTAVQPTDDIHFHAAVLVKARMPKNKYRKWISRNLRHLAAALNIAVHPAVLKVEPVTQHWQVAAYLNKYVTKQKGENGDGTWQDGSCSPIFTSRTMSVSEKLTSRYRERADEFVRVLDREGELAELSRRVQLLTKFNSSFCEAYHYSDYLWQHAAEITASRLACASATAYQPAIRPPGLGSTDREIEKQPSEEAARRRDWQPLPDNTTFLDIGSELHDTSNTVKQSTDDALQ